MPTVLLVLSFPAGALAYAATVQALEALQLSGDGREILILFVPLFVAGLVMMPFLIPYLDRRAKEDLASITRQRAADRGGGPDEGLYGRRARGCRDRNHDPVRWGAKPLKLIGNRGAYTKHC